MRFTFRINRYNYISLPWWIAIPLSPLLLGLWVLVLTCRVIRWVWAPPRQKRGEDRVRVSVRLPADDA